MDISLISQRIGIQFKARKTLHVSVHIDLDIHLNNINVYIHTRVRAHNIHTHNVSSFSIRKRGAVYDA